MHYVTILVYYFTWDGTKLGLWTGLDSTAILTSVISLREWAWLATEVLLLVTGVHHS